MRGHTQTSMAGVRAMNDARRVYPRAGVGDVFGERTVTKLLPPDAAKNERVEWQCRCGHWGTSLVFNLRNMKPVCIHAAGRTPGRPSTRRLTLAERVFVLEEQMRALVSTSAPPVKP